MNHPQLKNPQRKTVEGLCDNKLFLFFRSQFHFYFLFTAAADYLHL